MIDSRQALNQPAPRPGWTRHPWRWWAVALLVELGLFMASAPRVRGLLANTWLLILGTLAISLPLGTLLAVLVAKTDVVGRKWLGRLLLSLLLVPLYVQTAAWQAAFGWGGWLPAWLATINFCHPGQMVWLTGWRGALWVHAMAAVPWVTLLMAVAMGGIARELEEDALMHGSPGQVIWRVTMRHAWAGMALASLWTAAVCASEITVTDLFQIRTFAEEIYTAARLGALAGARTDGFSEETLLGSLGPGLAMLGVLVVAAVALMGRWFIAKESVASPWRLRLLRGRWLATGLGWLLVVLLVGLPLVSMAWKAGTQVESEGDRLVRGWSAVKLAHELAVSPVKHRREWSWSFVLGCSVAVVATTGGTLLAWGLRKRWLPVGPVAIVLAFGFGMPGPVLGVWIIRCLNWPSHSPLGFLTWCYDKTLLAPLLAQTIRALPLVTLLLWTQMESVSQDLLDSAAGEGAGGWSQLTRVVLPLRWPGVLAAACVAFIVAIGELAATVLVVPPGVSTLSIRIFGLLHYGAEDQVAALCLAIWLLTSLLAVGAFVLVEKVERGES